MTRSLTLCIAALMIAGALPATARKSHAAGSSSLTIESILKAGWEIAGYAGNFDNRATFILFKKPGEAYLIQCLAGYDVTRATRVFSNCYELR